MGAVEIVFLILLIALIAGLATRAIAKATTNRRNRLTAQQQPQASPAQTVECPSCHRQNPAGTKFCPECGTRMWGAV